MSVPEFHNFREAMEHLAKGGAVRRYGSFYPYYVPGVMGIERRIDGRSLGECVEHNVQFTVDEQQSTNWVLEPVGMWKERDEQYRAAWRKLRDERHEREVAARVTPEVAEVRELAFKNKWLERLYQWWRGK